MPHNFDQAIIKERFRLINIQTYVNHESKEYWIKSKLQISTFSVCIGKWIA